VSGPREATPSELEDWDAAAVDAPGGHVYQSRAWADHRRASGWEPRFLVLEDGSRVLSLERSWPLLGGGSAYIPRGPAPVGGVGAALADRQIAVSETLAAGGIDVVAADPEVPAADEAFVTAIVAAGFAPIEEIQPSRHRITLPLDDGVDEMLAFGHIAKSTRQRIRAAETSGLVIVRHDGRIGDDGVGEGFVAPTEAADVALDRFYDLLLATGERRQFTFGPRAGFVGWWRAALAAGHLVYLEVRDGGPAGTPLAGLVLYRHGGRLSTVHSGDRAETRRSHPGALHLARWRAIQLAIRERASEMDLGGADLPGARREPVEGEPMWGLYQHKVGFGGRWLALAGAHERVFRPRRYAAGRLTARAARLVRR
jgi:lipid II:glycine glycyltransferase (peptidoglycan interpeptide bridge formation enzyme)